LVKLSENRLDELCSPLGTTQELTVVPSSSGEKAHILFAKVRGQRCHSYQIITVVAEK
jgi:hypothetical protein